MGPHNRMVIFLTPYEYSHKKFVVDTQYLHKLCTFFCNGTEMSREQHIYESFINIVCLVMNIIDFLDTVYGSEHNYNVFNSLMCMGFITP